MGLTTISVKNTILSNIFELIDKVGTHKFQRGRLFDRLLLSDKVNTTTLENYAKLCFFQRTTLQDELGEEFGFDF